MLLVIQTHACWAHTSLAEPSPGLVPRPSSRPIQSLTDPEGGKGSRHDDFPQPWEALGERVGEEPDCSLLGWENGSLEASGFCAVFDCDWGPFDSGKKSCVRL